jgi:DNA polymerase elongation subunit (family B)
MNVNFNDLLNEKDKSFDDSILYGKDSTLGIVSVSANRKGIATVWRRVEGKVITEIESFHNWFVISDPSLLDGIKAQHEVFELVGEHPFKYQVLTKNYTTLEYGIVKNYNAKYKTNHKTFYDLPNSAVVHFPTTEQYLISTGRTYFKGMNWDNLHRLQFDLETYSLHPEESGIFLIAISDNRGLERIIDDDSMSEAELIRELIRIIQERDPDIIENHNIFDFDLPFLEHRAKMHKIKLTLGRDGRRPSVDQEGSTTFPQRGTLKVGESTVSFTRYCIQGREVIDTLHAVRRWNAIARELTSEGLKEAAQYFSISSQNREYIDGDKIGNVWKSDKERVRRYALDDVKEVAFLSDMLMQDKFNLAQIIPMPFEKVATSGTASALDTIMIRGYLQSECGMRNAECGIEKINNSEFRNPKSQLRKGHSLPKPQERIGTFKGGRTDLFIEGVVENVLHADVSSMYPTIMLTKNIKPSSDTLDLFLSILSALTASRLDAKRKLKVIPLSTPEYAQINALQSAMKILINSAYGYLGTSFTLFNDPQKAAEVTLTGREILGDMLTAIRELSGDPIEADTDGVYLRLPDGANPDEFIKAIKKKITHEGVVIDGETYEAMFSIGMKNYALSPFEKGGQGGFHDGKPSWSTTEGRRLIVKGAGLKASDLEPAFADFLKEGLAYLLRGDIKGLRACYENLVEGIRNGSIEIEQLAKTTRLSKSVTEYQKNHKATQPHYEALIAAGIKDLKKDATVSYYKARGGWKLTKEYNNDLDQYHYLNRLDQTALRFEKAFSRTDFHTLFNSEPDLFAAATDIIKPTWRYVSRESGENKEWIELAHGIKIAKEDPAYKVERHVWVEAEDSASISAFCEQFESVDIYKSALSVLSVTSPDGELSQYPRCGDFFMEFEGSKDDPDRKARAIKAAHEAYSIIDEMFGCADAITYRHNGGGKSLYLFIPMNYFETSAVYNLTLKYKVVAKAITEKLPKELQDIPDLTLYDNPDRLLRFPESIYPDGGYDVEIPKELIFSEDWNAIIEYSKKPSEDIDAKAEAPDPEATQQTFSAYAEMTKEVKTDPPKGKTKVSTKKRVKRKQAQRFWNEHFKDAQAPCVVKLAEAVASGESIGFEGRNKLIWECYQGGYSEATIADLFLAYGDPARYGVLEEYPDGPNGYRLKARFNPFLSDKLSMMDPKCEKVTQWCDWVNCYRAERFRKREQHEQLSFYEFRERGRALLQEATDNDKNYSKEYITAIDGSMAAGKTYQIARKSIELTGSGHPTSVLGPTHSACSKALSEIEKLGGVSEKVVCVHVFGQREDTCIDEYFKKNQTCSSCKIFKQFFKEGKDEKEAKKKYAQRIRIQMGNKGRIIDLPQLWEIANDYNACACVIGKILAAPESRESGLTALTVMPHAYIITPQNRTLIQHRIRPEYLFVDEADMMIDAMLPCHIKELRIASTRSRLDSLYSKPCGMQCDKCHIHFSDTYTNHIRPKGKVESADQYKEIGKPKRFGDFLRECIKEAQELEEKTLIFPSVFLFDELLSNIERIETALSVVKLTEEMTPDKYLIALRDELLKNPIEGVEIEELYEGLSYEELDEKTGKMVVKEIRPPVHVAKLTIKSCLERAYFIPQEAFDPDWDGYIVDQDAEQIGSISLNNVWASEGAKMRFKDTDTERRLKALLEFASFCEFAQREKDDPKSRTVGMYFESRESFEEQQKEVLRTPNPENRDFGDDLEESYEREINRKYGAVNACGIKLRYLDTENYRGTVNFLRTRKTMMLSGTFLDRDRLAESLLLKKEELNYVDARVPMHRECLILHHNPDMGKLVRNLTGVSLARFSHNHARELYNKIVQKRSDTKFLHYAINTVQGNLFYGNLAKDSGNSIFYIQNECPKRIQIPDWCSPEVKPERSLNWLFIDKLRSPTARASDREQFDVLTVHRNGYPNWYDMMPLVSAVKQFVNEDVDLEEFIEYNRQRAVFQALLRNPRNEQRHVSIYLSGDLHYTAYPDYLRNRVIPTEILMDLLKAEYPDKFLSNRETQIELLARVAAGFLDGTILDIDDPIQVFNNFEFKGDYGKGESPRKVEVDLSNLSLDEKYLIETFVEEHSGNTDHARAYQTAIERLEHVKKCVAEKGYVDRVKDKKGKRQDWKNWIEHLIDKNFIEPVEIKVEGKKSKTGYKIAENADVD